MSNHRENALAFALSRTLSMLQQTRGDSTNDYRSPITGAQIDSLAHEVNKLLSSRHTQSDPSALIGIADAGIVARASGWMIQLLSRPLDQRELIAGAVTVTPPEGQGNELAVYFRLVRDPMHLSDFTQDSKELARAAACLVQLSLNAKGLEGWKTTTAQIRFNKYDGVTLAGTHVSLDAT